MNTLLLKTLKPIFMAVSKLPINNPHHDKEIELMVLAQKPVCVISITEELKRLRESPNREKQKTIENFQAMIKEDQISLIGETIYGAENRKFEVFAQRDKIEAGKEVFARLYLNGEGYPELNLLDHHKRIGELLGYNENDLGRSDVCGLYDFFLHKTRRLRLNIRNLQHYL